MQCSLKIMLEIKMSRKISDWCHKSVCQFKNKYTVGLIRNIQTINEIRSFVRIPNMSFFDVEIKKNDIF